MALKTTVAVGMITTLSDARYCAGMGVTYLCFPAHRVNPKTFTEITSWVSGPTFVIDVSQLPEVNTSIEEYETDYILISTRQFKMLPTLLGKKLIVKWDVTDRPTDFDFEKSSNTVVFHLINDSQIADFPIEKGLSTLVKIQEPSLLAALLDQKITGIWLDGTDEDRPGLKDYSTLEVVLEQLEIES